MKQREYYITSVQSIFDYGKKLLGNTVPGTVLLLIDGQELARYMIEYNVGVSTKQVYEVKRIDSDYFEE